MDQNPEVEDGELVPAVLMTENVLVEMGPFSWYRAEHCGKRLWFQTAFAQADTCTSTLSHTCI